VPFTREQERVKGCVEQVKATEHNNLILRMVMTEEKLVESEMLSKMDDITTERVLVYLKTSGGTRWRTA
jgi:hypothetical protein